MFTFEVENSNGERIRLTQNESIYQIVSIEGLNPPKATLNLTTIAGMNGARYKSSYLETRNIVVTVALNGDVEKNRLRLYNFFRTGAWCKMYYTNDSREVYIEGYCENIDGSLFQMKETMQFSVICPDPYFKSVSEILSDISKVFGNFEFPFDIEEEGMEFSIIESHREAEIYNAGEVPCGVIITLTAEADGIANPLIYNTKNENFIGLELTLNQGDQVVINTNKGQKSITKYVDGIAQNEINSLMANSTWLQLEPGLSKFYYSADESEEYLKVTFEHRILYQGV